MASDRYALQKGSDGRWMVLDVRTSVPASHRNHVMIRMGLDEADAMVDLLNARNRRQNPKVVFVRPTRQARPSADEMLLMQNIEKGRSDAYPARLCEHGAQQQQ